MRNITLLAVLLLFLGGCGYKPASVEARKVLKNDVYVDSRVNLKDLENSVIIKDSLNEAIISRFGGRIASEADAETRINIHLNDVTFKTLLTDNRGYSVVYRAIVKLDFEVADKTGTIQDRFATYGNYDFSSEANSVISDKKRFEAIKQASQHAIDEFISKIAVKGYL